MNSKNKKKSAQKRQCLITAFCLIYQEKSFEKISVQSVAKKAGFDRTTFYQYFLDLDDLLNQLEGELLDYITNKRPAITEENNQYYFMNALVDLYQARATEVNALLGPHGRSHFIVTLKNKLDFDLFHLDKEKKNQYQPYLIEFRLFGALDLFSLWLERNQDLTVAELVEMVIKLFQTNPGLKELTDQ